MGTSVEEREIGSTSAQNGGATSTKIKKVNFDFSPGGDLEKKGEAQKTKEKSLVRAELQKPDKRIGGQEKREIHENQGGKRGIQKNYLENGIPISPNNRGLCRHSREKKVGSIGKRPSLQKYEKSTNTNNKYLGKGQTSFQEFHNVFARLRNGTAEGGDAKTTRKSFEGRKKYR